jgi:hypothetical protein
MADLRSVLAEAVDADIIPREASDRLAGFLSERGVVVADPQRAQAKGALAADNDPELPAVEVDTETPRFVRGFHDVLITIGVVVALSGLWGLTGLAVVPFAIIVLSEILVKRQRLALPAVVLTIAVMVWTGAVASTWLAEGLFFIRGGDVPIRFAAPFPVVLGLYYLRYRVPISLALCIITALGLLLTVIIRLVSRLSGDALFFVNHPHMLSVIFLLSALGLFIAALQFDLSDRERLTRRSDIAFWLHLASAPALLYSVVWGFSLSNNLSDLTQAISAKTFVVVGTVAVLMLIGLVIDRRAFVTSGLLSLGYALYGVFRLGTAGVDTYIFTTLLTVGLIVLVIGTGWRPLRRRLIGALPKGLALKLPPV